MRHRRPGPPSLRLDGGGRKIALFLVCLLAMAMLPATVASATGETIFTFVGGGYGHAVGMSQYGAYGMSLQGHTWEEILTHYYTGVSVTDADPALASTPLWVNLSEEQARVELTPVSTGRGTPVRVIFTMGDRTLAATEGVTVVVEHLGGGRCRIGKPGRSIEGPCSIDAGWDGWVDQPTTALELGGCYLPDWNAPGGTVWRPCRYARGTLHLRPDDGTPTVNLSLEIGVEDYLLGISEMPYSWGSTGGMEALKAQAVAARSYALRRLVDRGNPAGRPWCWCHLYDTTVDQFYVGWGHGRAEWLEAVTATAGKVVTHPADTREGRLIPIQAFYASSTFGWTEDSENGFTAYVPYLRAVDDHWGLLPQADNPWARWTRSLTATDLASRLPGMTTVTGARVTLCSATGAALEITFTGEGGPRAFSTRDLRTRLGLRSMQVINVGAPPPATPACSGSVLPPAPGGGPVALVGLSVDDDAADDSRGNGDGVAQCGEFVEVSTTLVNGGGDLAGVTATLTSADPHVSILWNTTSAYPDLAERARAGNLDDWDLSIAPDAPDGHLSRLQLRVMAANGGPWDLEVALPVSCTTPLAGTVASPGDLNGDGAPEWAIAYAESAGPAYLRVRDGKSGELLAAARLAPAGYIPLDMAVIPHFEGSAAAEVAVLLARPDGRARAVVVDAGTGSRLAAFPFPSRNTYLALEAVPSTGGSPAPEVAVLGVRPDGAVRVFLRDAGTRQMVARVPFGRDLSPVDLAALPDIGGGPGPDLVVLGRVAGQGQALIRDAGTRAMVARVSLGQVLTPLDLEVLSLSGATSALAVLAEDADGTLRIVTTDPGTGGLLGLVTVANLVHAFDLEVLADLGGGPSPDVAVLGSAADGTVVVTVADPLTGNLLAAREFPGGYRTDVLAAFPGAPVLAALGRAPGGDSTLTLSHALSGAPLASIPVP